jgi:hypothetical protein
LYSYIVRTREYLLAEKYLPVKGGINWGLLAHPSDHGLFGAIPDFQRVGDLLIARDAALTRKALG